MVTVKFGCQSSQLESGERSVSDLAEALSDVFGLAGNETYRVEGHGGVGADYIPEDGDVVELVKAAGTKG